MVIGSNKLTKLDQLQEEAVTMLRKNLIENKNYDPDKTVIIFSIDPESQFRFLRETKIDFDVNALVLNDKIGYKVESLVFLESIEDVNEYTSADYIPMKKLTTDSTGLHTHLRKENFNIQEEVLNETINLFFSFNRVLLGLIVLDYLLTKKLGFRAGWTVSLILVISAAYIGRNIMNEHY